MFLSLLFLRAVSAKTKPVSLEISLELNNLPSTISIFSNNLYIALSVSFSLSFSSLGPKIGADFRSSFGLKLNYIFGSLYSYVQHKVYDITYDTDENIGYALNSNEYYTTINNYNGYGLEAEFSLIYKNQKI